MTNLILGFGLITIRTMPATVFATIAAFEMVSSCKNHFALNYVIIRINRILLFDYFFRILSGEVHG
jgi:hypothetical protein